MCFLSPSGGGRGDVTQNSYYNSRPWEPTDVPRQRIQPVSDFTSEGAEKLAIGHPGLPSQSAKKANRSSLTTGGSA